MLRRRPVLANAGAVLCLLVAGCSGGSVEVIPADLDDAEQTACGRLVDALPDVVADQQRRDVEPQHAYGAAWGDPAIVLTCGVGEPAGFDDFSTCQVTNGVGWFIPEEQITGRSTAIVMTTVDRTPAVEVRVPEEYFPPAAAMVNLADAVKATTEQDDPCL